MQQQQQQQQKQKQEDDGEAHRCSSSSSSFLCADAELAGRSLLAPASQSLLLCNLALGTWHICGLGLPRNYCHLFCFLQLQHMASQYFLARCVERCSLSDLGKRI